MPTFPSRRAAAAFAGSPISASKSSSNDTGIWIGRRSGAVDAITRPSATIERSAPERDDASNMSSSSQNPPRMVPIAPDPTSLMRIGGVRA
jgi:hypothetical protein